MEASKNSKHWNTDKQTGCSFLFQPFVGVSCRLTSGLKTLLGGITGARTTTNSCLCHSSLTVPETLAWLAFLVIRWDNG